MTLQRQQMSPSVCGCPVENIYLLEMCFPRSLIVTLDGFHFGHVSDIVLVNKEQTSLQVVTLCTSSRPTDKPTVKVRTGEVPSAASNRTTRSEHTATVLTSQLVLELIFFFFLLPSSPRSKMYFRVTDLLCALRTTAVCCRSPAGYPQVALYDRG